MRTDEATCSYAEHDDIIGDYLSSRLTPAEAEAFEAHYLACDACVARLRSALEVRAAFAEMEALPGHVDATAGALPSPSDRAARPGRISARRWWPVAAAAALATLVVSVWWLTPTSPAYEGVLRGPSDEWRVTTTVQDDAFVAAWSPVPDAELYRVRLFAADGTLLIDRPTPDTMLVVAAGELAPGTAAALLYWEVRAFDRLRETLARSELVAMPLAERP